MDIKDIIKNKPFTEISTEIGELSVFSITTGRQRDLLQELGNDYSKCNSSAFVRSFMRYTCVPKDKLVDGKYLPRDILISSEDAGKLSAVDLENFASVYIEKNDYLYLDSIREETTGKDGIPVIAFKKGEITHSRLPEETSVDYLYRLCIIEYEEMKKSLEAFAKPFAKFKHFSDTLNQDIRNTFNLGDSLRGTFATVGKPTYEIKSYDRVFESISRASAEKEERQLKPLKEMSMKFDTLIDATSKVADFLVDMNRLQTGIAEELKESGDNAVKFSKINIRLNWTVIGLTIITLLFTIISYFSNQRESTLQNAKNIDVLSMQLNKVSSDISANTDKNASAFVEQFNSIVKVQIETLNELKEQNRQNKLLMAELHELRARNGVSSNETIVMPNKSQERTE